MNPSVQSGPDIDPVAITFEFGSADDDTHGVHSVSGAAATLRREMRESLGLPAHFLAGAGHQPILWHAGILAKFLAAAGIARARTGPSSWVHFLSDQDAIDPFRMDVPVRDGARTIRRASIRLVASDPDRARDAVAAARPAQGAREIDAEQFASPEAVEACNRVRTAIDQTRGEATAGVQLARVMHACAARWLPAPCAVVTSHALMSPSAAQAVVERILRDPVANAQAFNAALQSDPHAAKPLHIAGDSTEVPLWGVAADGRRERIGASEARRRLAQGRMLLPRAFLASGFMRVICDTFVHGIGGARYERVGEAWWRTFLGIELPSFATASATLLPSPAALGLRADAAAANSVAWRSAWWDPTRLDRNIEGVPRVDRGLIEPVRAAMLARIAEAPRRSAARRDGYRALSAYIETLRVSHRGELEALHRSESQQRTVRSEHALLRDRTWPTVLLADSAIDEMAQAITARISARGQKPA